MRIKTHGNLSFALATTLSASACFAEPSDADVSRAVNDVFAKAYASQVQMGGRDVANRVASKLHSAKKIACAKQSERAFTCDVEIDATEGFTNMRTKAVRQMRFVQAGDKSWLFSQ